MRFEFDPVGGGKEGTVREHVLPFAHVENHDVAGEVRSEEDASGFVVRDEGLLEEVFVVQELAGKTLEEAPAGFALERDRAVHRHHGVGFGGDALTGFERNAKEGIDAGKYFEAGHGNRFDRMGKRCGTVCRVSPSFYRAHSMTWELSCERQQLRILRNILRFHRRPQENGRRGEKRFGNFTAAEPWPRRSHPQ